MNLLYDQKIALEIEDNFLNTKGPEVLVKLAFCNGKGDHTGKCNNEI